MTYRHQQREAAADRLEAEHDMRIEVVRRELNQGALAGMHSEVTEHAAALVVAALDAYEQHLREQRSVQRPTDKPRPRLPAPFADESPSYRAGYRIGQALFGAFCFMLGVAGLVLVEVLRR